MADMKCKNAVVWIHEYLDGDLASEQHQELKKHLDGCTACMSRLEALERTDALTRTLPAQAAPFGLSYRINKSLPKRSTSGWTRWVRRHPAATAAAFFLVVMLSSFMAMWNQDRELSIAGPDLDSLIIEGKEVIVPEGLEIKGDLTVSNGNVRVYGDVQGNLTVIDGHVMPLASTAHIAGEIRTIDRAIDWMWYKVSSWFGSLAY